jgi:hypothetical protein
MPLPKPQFFSLTLVAMASSTLSLADTTFDNNPFAWEANTGWIIFRHDRPTSPAGVTFGGAFLSGYAWSANLGWINLGNGTPANGYSYSNTGRDHGVNHDGTGNLSGFAWSANTGWINFGWTIVSDSNRPRVNLLTGEFAGYAWSANTGWLNLGTGLLTTQSISDVDSDGDGIADWWEMLHFGNLTTANATSDFDGDGVPDLAEFRADTDPKDAASFLKIVSHSHDADLTETTLEFTTTPTRLYRIESSNDLGQDDSWSDSVLGVFAPDAAVTTTRTITYPGTPRKFFRAVAVMPIP